MTKLFIVVALLTNMLLVQGAENGQHNGGQVVTQQALIDLEENQPYTEKMRELDEEDQVEDQVSYQVIEQPQTEIEFDTEFKQAQEQSDNSKDDNAAATTTYKTLIFLCFTICTVVFL